MRPILPRLAEAIASGGQATAQALGLPPGTLDRLAVGRAIATPRLEAEIADALGIPREELFALDPEHARLAGEPVEFDPVMSQELTTIVTRLS